MLVIFGFFQEDFLLLCPMHSSVKFPNEKSRNCVVRKDPVPLQVYALIPCSFNTPMTLTDFYCLDSFE